MGLLDIQPRMGLLDICPLFLAIFIHFPDAGNSYRGSVSNVLDVRATIGPSCWFPNYYCSITEENIIAKSIVSGGPNTCYTTCYDDIRCNFFTWFKRRGTEYCYRLQQCGPDYRIDNDWCLTRGPSCNSGPSNCSDIIKDNADCSQLNSYPDSIEWQCEDGGQGLLVNAYGQSLKAGTRCLLSCNSWTSFRWEGKSPLTYTNREKGFLFSTCQADGSWSYVRPNDYKDKETQLFWPSLASLKISAYPRPDETPPSCNCRDLFLIWPPTNTTIATDTFYYNPRDEEGATFECEDEIQNYDVQRSQEFQIQANNTCRFFCDDYLVATITCKDGQWTGGVDRGFWCYRQPQSPRKLATTHGCKCGLANRKERIVGGQETEVNEYPWQAGLIYYNRGNGNWGKDPSCGGSLISDQWILTAANCITTCGCTSESEIQVLLGDHNYTTTLDTESIRTTISDIFIHEDHLSSLLNSTQYPLPLPTQNYDFALLKLTNPIDFAAFPNIRPICLPENTNEDYAGLLATVTGWGLTSWNWAVLGQRSNVLRDVDVTVWDNSKCEEDYKLLANFTDQMLCANVPEGGKDICMYDGGNPLVTSGDGDGVTPGQNFEIIGVSSWGIPCAMPEYPGVYARITAGLDWIRDKTSNAWNTCPRI